MKLKAFSIAALVLSGTLDVNAADQWQHGALCGVMVKGMATAPQFTGAQPNEKAIEWLGRNGWELAAIETNHCVAAGSTPQKPLFNDLFWFKRRVDGQTQLSAMPPAIGAR